jgi:hypothetical protein
MQPPNRAGTRILIFDPFAGSAGTWWWAPSWTWASRRTGSATSWTPSGWAEVPCGAGGPERDRLHHGSSSGARRARHRHLPDVLEIVDRSTVPAGARELAPRRSGGWPSRGRRARRAGGAGPFPRGGRPRLHPGRPVRGGGRPRAGVRAVLHTARGRGVGDHGDGPRRVSPPGAGHGPSPGGPAVRETGYPEECTTPTGAAILATLTRGARRRRPRWCTVRAGSARVRAIPRGAELPACHRLHRRPRPETGCTWCRPTSTTCARVRGGGAGRSDGRGRAGCGARAGRHEEGAAGVPAGGAGPGGGTDQAVTDALFIGTRTIGVRYWEVDRTVLDREEEVVEWRGQRIRRKRVRLPDGRTRTKPEYEDVVAAARALGLAPHEVRAELEDG